MAGGEISYNKALATGSVVYGGGVFVYGHENGVSVPRSTLAMTGGAIISNNTASGSTYVYGGGVACRYYSDLTMTDAKITDNMAIGSGTGSFTYGGGIHSYWSCTITMNSNAVISDNQAKDGEWNRAGGVEIHVATLTMNGNALISSNTASGGTTSYGGGVFQSGGTFAMPGGTIMASNNATTGKTYYYSTGTKPAWLTSISYDTEIIAQ
jgi:hypothetical protein